MMKQVHARSWVVRFLCKTKFVSHGVIAHCSELFVDYDVSGTKTLETSDGVFALNVLRHYKRAAAAQRCLKQTWILLCFEKSCHIRGGLWVKTFFDLIGRFDV